MTVTLPKALPKGLEYGHNHNGGFLRITSMRGLDAFFAWVTERKVAR